MVFIPDHDPNWRKRRSVLFMPSSNERALAKAPGLECDGIIFDLEDAVSPSEQDGARQNLIEMVKNQDIGSKETAIRISAIDEDTFDGDLACALEVGCDAILLPKVNDAKTLEDVTAMISKAGKNRPTLWAMIETPMALMNLREIGASGLVTGLIVGPNDLAKETGTPMKPGRAAMIPWMMMVIAAARAYELFALDGVYNNFSDLEGLNAECEQGADMGFDGKTLIHPKQIETANKAFSPNDNEIARAQAIIELFAQPENADKSALQLAINNNSEMVERLHLEMARKLISAYG